MRGEHGRYDVWVYALVLHVRGEAGMVCGSVRYRTGIPPPAERDMGQGRFHAAPRVPGDRQPATR